MKLLLKAVVVFTMLAVVWLSSAAADADPSSSVSDNARERRSSDAKLLEDLLNSVEQQQQQQQAQAQEQEEDEEEETQVETQDDDDDDNDDDGDEAAVVMSVAEAEAMKEFLDAMTEADDAQIMTDADGDDDRSASVEFFNSLRKRLSRTWNKLRRRLPRIRFRFPRFRRPRPPRRFRPPRRPRFPVIRPRPNPFLYSRCLRSCRRIRG